MIKTTRAISWIKTALKDFKAFPESIQTDALRALTIAAQGYTADNVKSLKGFEKRYYGDCATPPRRCFSSSLCRSTG